jgi:hypothetical protein
VSNWDFVLPYNHDASAWLTEQGYPHPSPRAENRLPSTSEIKWAMAELGIDTDEPLIVIDDFDGNDDEFVPAEYFKIKGSRLVEIQLLTKLCERCGQLWLYPDTGEPSIVLDARMRPESILILHRESLDEDDPWAAFYESAYRNETHLDPSPPPS